jgi:hypothetical protein
MRALSYGTIACLLTTGFVGCGGGGGGVTPTPEAPVTGARLQIYADATPVGDIGGTPVFRLARVDRDANRAAGQRHLMIWGTYDGNGLPSRIVQTASWDGDGVSGAVHTWFNADGYPYMVKADGQAVLLAVDWESPARATLSLHEDADTPSIAQSVLEGVGDSFTATPLGTAVAAPLPAAPAYPLSLARSQPTPARADCTETTTKLDDLLSKIVTKTAVVLLKASIAAIEAATPLAALAVAGLLLPPPFDVVAPIAAFGALLFGGLAFIWTVAQETIMKSRAASSAWGTVTCPGDDNNNPFAGSYSGTFSGGYCGEATLSGTITATIAGDGALTASGPVHEVSSDGSVDYSFTATGSVGPDGSASFVTGSGQGIEPFTFTGTFRVAGTGATGSGSFSWDAGCSPPDGSPPGTPGPPGSGTWQCTRD